MFSSVKFIDTQAEEPSDSYQNGLNNIASV